MGEKVWGEWVLVRSHKTEDSAESEIERRRDHVHNKNSMSDYGILAVKWEKRHELMLPADSKVIQDASVTESQEVSRLQNQVTELQKRIKDQDEVLQKADEMNQETLELKTQHWLTTNELRIEREKLQQSQIENQALTTKNLELQNKLQTPDVGNSQPDYEAIRDRTLKKLKIGRQSAAGKAIDTFIREVERK